MPPREPPATHSTDKAQIDEDLDLGQKIGEATYSYVGHGTVDRHELELFEKATRCTLSKRYGRDFSASAFYFPAGSAEIIEDKSARAYPRCSVTKPFPTAEYREAKDRDERQRIFDAYVIDREQSRQVCKDWHIQNVTQVHGYAWPLEVDTEAEAEELSRRRAQAVGRWLENRNVSPPDEILSHGTSRTNGKPAEFEPVLGAQLARDGSHPPFKEVSYLAPPLSESEISDVRHVKGRRISECIERCEERYEERDCSLSCTVPRDSHGPHISVSIDHNALHNYLANDDIEFDQALRHDEDALRCVASFFDR